MKPIHILLVEDNEGDIVLTTDALKDGKIKNTFSIVRDGWEAIQYLEKKEGYENAEIPDLILLDINLPKINGHKVLKHIKNSSTLRMIPVVMLTTSSDEKDIELSYQNHSNCYITKPVDINDFLEVIASIENFWISIVQLPPQKE